MRPRSSRSTSSGRWRASPRAASRAATSCASRRVTPCFRSSTGRVASRCRPSISGSPASTARSASSASRTTSRSGTAPPGLTTSPAWRRRPMLPQTSMQLREYEMALAHTPVLLDELLELLRPAKGEVVVDCTFGAGRSSSSSSSRRTGVWARAISYSRSCMLVCGSIGLLLQAGLVVSPGGAVPDLDVVLDADDADLAVDAGEPEMLGRHRDATLPVELLKHGVTRREAHEVAALDAARGDALHLPLEVLLELLGRIPVEAVLVALGHVDTVGERRSQARGDGDAILRIEREVVLPHQDRSLHGRHFTPLFPTLQ